MARKHQNDDNNIQIIKEIKVLYARKPFQTKSLSDGINLQQYDK